MLASAIMYALTRRWDFLSVAKTSLMVFLDSNESLVLSEVGLAYDDIPACFEGRRRSIHTVYSLNIRCIDLPILSITIALVRKK